MNILITGGSGFIGSRLIRHLRNHHQITVLTRNPHHALQRIGFDIHTLTNLQELDSLDGFDAVINLAGEPIAQRWSERARMLIASSRWQITEQLVSLWRASQTPPQILISGSAIGYYGRQGSGAIDESYSDIHHEFSHQLCKRWEELALALKDEARVCILRTGIVLGQGGGALARMLPAFRLGLGGPIASGEQYMSWIHIDDMIKAIRFLLEKDHVAGIFNLTAPCPVTNAQFAAALGKALGRPAKMRVPAPIMRCLFGDMADLLIHGQRVMPQRLLDAGFHFCFTQLDDALVQLLKADK